MGVVALTEQRIMTFVSAIVLIEVLGGCCHIDEHHAQLCSQLLHLVAIVHGVVVSIHLQSGLDGIVNDGVVFVA